jgi:hypothetical protein
MHPCCDDWAGCGCLVCHHICGNPDCQRKCRKVFSLPQAGFNVCASCYKQMAPPVGRTTACESCGHPSAYMHPGKGDTRYLCSECHVAAGHLRRQDRGE